MNKYDEYYTFRIANIDDVENIMLFLKKEWKEDHILANDREMFMWQYGNNHFGDDNTINFVIMEDANKQIVGVNGYVPYSKEGDNRFISSAITKVKSQNVLPMAGVELVKRFRDLTNAKEEYSSGTNSKTMIPIAKRVMRYDVGIMKQYYILNPMVKNYLIAKPALNDTLTFGGELGKKYILVQKPNFEDTNFNFNIIYDNQGYKSKDYLIHRYCNHPIYEYIIYALWDGHDNVVGFLIAREISVQERKILRIVDYIGNINNLKEIGTSLQKILVDKNYEYIDLVTSGLNEEIINGMGLELRNDETVIPMYFEPFVRKNVDIWYQRSNEHITIFKADGDQDRPNYR